MADIQLLNDTPYDRTDIITVGIPYGPGELSDTGTQLICHGATSQSQIVQWYPQGALHPDGSYRYIRASFRADLLAHQSPTWAGGKAVKINSSGTPTAVPYSIPGAVLQGIGSVVINLFVNGSTHRVNLLDGALELVEGGGTNDHYARFRVFKRMTGLPQIWTEIVYDVLSNLNHVRFWFRFGYSYAETGKGTSAGSYPTKRFYLNDEVKLQIIGPTVHLRYEDYKTRAKTVSGVTTEYTLISPFSPTDRRLF
jgi:hypothetical protein